MPMSSNAYFFFGFRFNLRVLLTLNRHNTWLWLCQMFAIHLSTVISLPCSSSLMVYYFVLPKTESFLTKRDVFVAVLRLCNIVKITILAIWETIQTFYFPWVSLVPLNGFWVSLSWSDVPIIKLINYHRVLHFWGFPLQIKSWFCFSGKFRLNTANIWWQIS